MRSDSAPTHAQASDGPPATRDTRSSLHRLLIWCTNPCLYSAGVRRVWWWTQQATRAYALTAMLALTGTHLVVLLPLYDAAFGPGAEVHPCGLWRDVTVLGSARRLAAHQTTTCVLILMLLITYARATFSKPGYAPRATQPPPPSTGAEAVIIVDRPASQTTGASHVSVAPDTQSALEQLRRASANVHGAHTGARGAVGDCAATCTRCGARRIAGTHHCSWCNRCVDGFDHHCPTMATCIGVRNRRHFITALCTLALTLTYGVYALCACRTVAHDRSHGVRAAYLTAVAAYGALATVIVPFAAWHTFMYNVLNATTCSIGALGPRVWLRVICSPARAGYISELGERLAGIRVARHRAKNV